MIFSGKCPAEDSAGLSQERMSVMRTATVNRETRETQIQLTLNLDGSGQTDIHSGIGFLDHMLTALAVHGGLDLALYCQGDLEVDCHHTIEDIGIMLGKAVGQCLGDKGGIRRYGNFTIPMDEALASCSLDVSGRPYLVFQADFSNERIGAMDCCMVEEFFRALAFHAGITLHIQLHYGSNDHHKAEAIFKAVAHALREAVSRTEDNRTLSTKGALD